MLYPYNEVVIPDFIRDDTLLYEVYSFAAWAHEFRCTVTEDGGPHLRKYNHEPYIVHPVAVATILWEHGIRDVRQLAAALLHDTVEDTDVTVAELRKMFGKRIANITDGLTDVNSDRDSSRIIRKEENRLHSAQQDPETLTVKTADIIHNTADITELDPGFAVDYVHEIALLLKVMLKRGTKVKSDLGLYQRAVQQLVEYYEARMSEKFEAEWVDYLEGHSDAWQLEDGGPHVLEHTKAVAQEFYLRAAASLDERFKLVTRLQEIANNQEK